MMEKKAKIEAKGRNPTSLKRVDHIGIAVKSLDDHLDFYQQILGLEFLGIKTVDSQKVKVAMFKVGESMIELLEPQAEDSPISQFLAKRGQGLHHVCYGVMDIEQTLKQVKDRGVNLINEVPIVGAKGSKVAFLHPKSTGGVLTEFSEEKQV